MLDIFNIFVYVYIYIYVPLFLWICAIFFAFISEGSESAMPSISESFVCVCEATQVSQFSAL